MLECSLHNPIHCCIVIIIPLSLFSFQSLPNHNRGLTLKLTQCLYNTAFDVCVLCFNWYGITPALRSKALPLRSCPLITATWVRTDWSSVPIKSMPGVPGLAVFEAAVILYVNDMTLLLIDQSFCKVSWIRIIYFLDLHPVSLQDPHFWMLWCFTDTKVVFQKHTLSAICRLYSKASVWATWILCLILTNAFDHNS